MITYKVIVNYLDLFVSKYSETPYFISLRGSQSAK